MMSSAMADLMGGRRGFDSLTLASAFLRPEAAEERQEEQRQPVMARPRAQRFEEDILRHAPASEEGSREALPPSTDVGVTSPVRSESGSEGAASSSAVRSRRALGRACRESAPADAPGCTAAQKAIDTLLSSTPPASSRASSSTDALTTTTSWRSPPAPRETSSPISPQNASTATPGQSPEERDTAGTSRRSTSPPLGGSPSGGRQVGAPGHLREPLGRSAVDIALDLVFSNEAWQLPPRTPPEAPDRNSRAADVPSGYDASGADGDEAWITVPELGPLRPRQVEQLAAFLNGASNSEIDAAELPDLSHLTSAQLWRVVAFVSGEGGAGSRTYAANGGVANAVADAFVDVVRESRQARAAAAAAEQSKEQQERWEIDEEAFWKLQVRPAACHDCSLPGWLQAAGAKRAPPPDERECAICCERIMPAAIVLPERDPGGAVALPCSDRGCRSFFHSQCIRPWLEKNPNCPLCRRNLGKLVRKPGSRREEAAGVAFGRLSRDTAQVPHSLRDVSRTPAFPALPVESASFRELDDALERELEAMLSRTPSQGADGLGARGFDYEITTRAGHPTALAGHGSGSSASFRVRQIDSWHRRQPSGTIPALPRDSPSPPPPPSLPTSAGRRFQLRYGAATPGGRAGDTDSPHTGSAESFAPRSPPRASSQATLAASPPRRFSTTILHAPMSIDL
eukprot:TRINITY_DN18436_c0_g1_i2.p1 TRINITY_DN18436_c0_g1~~TRINITY_DN18436_c0_g1_i2.p1  ORF type:complete len:685 (-),score=131.92 TRINITY_DN18436_c0_g1_i2:207-2261(-)